jgi:hypothetical protein
MRRYRCASCGEGLETNAEPGEQERCPACGESNLVPDWMTDVANSCEDTPGALCGDEPMDPVHSRNQAVEEVAQLLQDDPGAGRWLIKKLTDHPRPLANDKEVVLYLTEKQMYEEACLRTSAALREAYRAGDLSEIAECDAAATRAINELAHVHSLAHYKGTALRRHRTWIVVAAVYLVGCLLLYFGIANALMDLCATGTWGLKPEPDLFLSFVDAAVTLIRPALVVFLPFIVLLTLTIRLATLAAKFPALIALAAVAFGLGKFLVWLCRRLRGPR